MAGGTLSPRQKMINLMYLVFIAMLALNMSKEVLSAFGLLEEKITEANVATDKRNDAFMANLVTKATDEPQKYADLKEKATAIKTLSDDLDDYIESIKTGMMGTVGADDQDNYEVQDKPDYLDTKFFKGDVLSEDGLVFQSNMLAYRDGIVAELADNENYSNIKEAVNKQFSLNPVTPRGKKKEKDAIMYHFEGFPMVASKTKLTQIQANVKTIQNEILSTMLRGEQAASLKMDNYSTLLESPKSAYYAGEKFDGSIVLGRVDSETKPSRAELTLDGRTLVEGTDYTFEGGRVALNISAGNPGEHKLEGQLIFKEDGEETPVEVNRSFSTISPPNSATISADKMNVVYRGVKNPLTISMDGVPNNNVNANAPGLSRGSGSAYIMDVTTVQGREVKINVTGTIDGKSFPSSKTFRIKDIPRPTGTIRGEDGNGGPVRMQRQGLEISTVGAMLLDFDFDLKLNVAGFSFKVAGQPTVKVSGNKLNDQAKSALKRAKRGETVQIFDINAKISGNSSYKLPRITPVFVELAN